MFPIAISFGLKVALLRVLCRVVVTIALRELCVLLGTF